MKVTASPIKNIGLLEALNDYRTGDIFKVTDIGTAKYSFRLAEYLLNCCSVDGTPLLLSLSDINTLSQKCVEENQDWETVRVLKMPKGFQLTLEQE